VAITDELSDEEQAIMRFLKRYFEASGMPNALWILNETRTLRMFEQFLMGTVSFIKSTERTEQSDGPLSARSCPRCNGYVGIVIRESGRKTPLQAVNGRCTRCAYRMAWVVIRGRKTSLAFESRKPPSVSP
jgi:hypothetical protein